MIHPAFRLAASQPLLLAGHAAAYADLASEALAARGALLKRRWVLTLTGAARLVVAAVGAPWLCVATPPLPAALRMAAHWLAHHQQQTWGSAQGWSQRSPC